ncbi:hypothetical protein D6C93_10421 [Aureobasidium pullulans]|nr:hypothetical protein D6C93_10421 [Aureobasidium pullulans]
MIKCVYWGGPVSQDNAVNKGQMRGNFDVRIAGSNGYITTKLSTPAGFQDAVPYGKFAINAPYDAQGYNTFMGSKIFTQGTWNANLCSDYCNSQTAYNKATAPKDGTPYKVCNFFNTYILTVKKADGTVQPQGQYCSLYTEAWPIKYATNGGQWRGQDQYTPFCSAYLGYSIPVSTVTSVATTVPVVTSTSYSTTTVSPKNDKRALSIPADLSKYPATVVSSACSMQATKPSSTSTTTAFSTFTAAASTSVVSVVSTTTAAPAPTTTSFKLATSNGNLIGTETSDTDGTETNTADIIYAFQPATAGSVFTLNYQTGELTVAYGGSQYSLLEAWWENGIFPLAKFSNAPGSHAKSSCSLTSSQGLYCGGNYFSICPNDINLHYANYVPSSSCVKDVLVAVPLV